MDAFAMTADGGDDGGERGYLPHCGEFAEQKRFWEFSDTHTTSMN